MQIELSEGKTRSADGTAVGYLTVGSGSPLVLVHGSLSTAEEWLPVAIELASRHSCYLVDRRGRGRSEDSSSYSLDKEREDIQAVLEIAGPSASLLGHSYGGICAIETANRFPVARLILYEPPLPIRGTVVGPAFADVRSAVADGRIEDGLTVFLRDLVKVSADELAGLKSSPEWQPMIALMPSCVRECEVIQGMTHGVARFSRMKTPTLLLLGTATAKHHVEATRALENTLANARVVEFPGHGHFANLTATGAVAGAIAAFLA
jgi:pimeloyl-ACP methyl ester carboxylesterase